MTFKFNYIKINYTHLVMSECTCVFFSTLFYNSIHKNDTVTENCDESRADVVFVIDSSGSIRDNNPEDESYDNYNLLLQFVANVTNELNTGIYQTRIGLVRYSATAESVFFLNSYFDKAELISAILSVGYMGSDTNTSGALREMRTVQFTLENGDRGGIPNVAIVITDGVSTIDTNLTIPEAEQARADNITVFSVGVTDKIDGTELRGISSLPQIVNNNYFTSIDFTTLSAVKDRLVESTCVGTIGSGNFFFVHISTALH